jgi:hypothetical protein
MMNRTRLVLIEDSEDEWEPPEDFVLTEVPPIEEHEHDDLVMDQKIDE